MRNEMNAQKILELRSLSIFRHAPAPVIGGASALLQDREYRKGECIQQRDESVPVVLFLRDGIVRVDRPQGPLEFSAPAHLGLFYALSQLPSQATVTASTDVRAFSLDIRDLFDLFEDHFALLRSALREVARFALAENKGGLAVQFAFAKSRQRVEPKATLDLVDRLFFLRRMFTFPHVSVDAVASVARQLEPKTFAPGEAIWKRGDPAINLTMIVHGTVECRSDAEEAALEGGGPLGGLEVFAQSARWYDLTAKTETLVLQASYDAVIDMLEEHIDMGTGLLSSLSATLLNLRQEHGVLDVKRSEPGVVSDGAVSDELAPTATASA